MAYTPFKMQGHELPGPNQRPPVNEEELIAENEQQMVEKDQPNNQLSTDVTDFSASGATSDATKKKVDVEVTVNGQPV